MNIDGITFASKAEAFHYQNLRLLEAAGIISELELQPEFIILKKSRDKFTGKTISQSLRSGWLMSGYNC